MGIQEGRRCHGCGKWYFRVNTIDVWSIRMPGKRLGWLKQKVKMCNDCFNQRQAERALTLVHANVIPLPTYIRKRA